MPSLGGNGTRLYNVDPARLRSEAIHFDNDIFAKLKKLHEAQGIGPPQTAGCPGDDGHLPA